jgi:hypothetical protein
VRDGYRSINGQRYARRGGRTARFLGQLLQHLRVVGESTDNTIDRRRPDGLRRARTLHSPGSGGGLARLPPHGGGGASLPTGLAQAMYTRFLNLPVLDRASALPLALAFCD